jgi:hypothetical protein
MIMLLIKLRSPRKLSDCHSSIFRKPKYLLNIYVSVHRNNILVYNSNKIHKSQSLFNLTTDLHVSGVTITHLQEHFPQKICYSEIVILI